MAGVGGLHSGATSGNLSRTLDRVLEESVLTGEILLSGRKLKEFPKSASKYNLSDTVIAGKSFFYVKNQFGWLRKRRDAVGAQTTSLEASGL